MQLVHWENLPLFMQNEAVRPYYESLRHKSGSLFCKRCFDLCAALCLLLLFSPILLGLSFAVHLDSPGPIFFRQVRITQYGKEFRIFKFRTMVPNAEGLGAQVTTNADTRVTRVGHLLRRLRLDELPQLLNVLLGEMTFVGTRPEVPHYVAQYTQPMLATLLLPAGITSRASIEYKEEEQLLSATGNTDKTYVEEVLPQKMRYNLEDLLQFSNWNDLKTMLYTVLAVIR